MERARDYALHNLRGITESQRAFIKFTQPEIYENLIFPQVVTPVDEIGHVKKEDYKDKIGEDIRVMVVGKNPIKFSEKAMKKVFEEEAEIEEIKNALRGFYTYRFTP